MHCTATAASRVAAPQVARQFVCVRRGATNMRNSKTSPRRRGFSLIELVIVVVIIGIIAAIAIPRMSRGTAGAADSALSGNLNVLRNAIELYATEHGGKFPSGDAD